MTYSIEQIEELRTRARAALKAIDILIAERPALAAKQTGHTTLGNIRAELRAAIGYRTKFLDYDSRRLPKTDHSCIRCQKDIGPGAQYRMIHVVDGGIGILHPEDEGMYNDPASDLGLQAVGSKCARIIGPEWTHPPLEEESP